MDTETGLYLNSGYIGWDKIGKTYISLSNVRKRLTATAQDIACEYRNNYIIATIGSFSEYKTHEAYNSAYLQHVDQKLMNDLHDLIYNKNRRKELYDRFIPKTWKIVEFKEVIDDENDIIERLFT